MGVAVKKAAKLNQKRNPVPARWTVPTKQGVETTVLQLYRKDSARGAARRIYEALLSQGIRISYHKVRYIILKRQRVQALSVWPGNLVIPGKKPNPKKKTKQTAKPQEPSHTVRKAAIYREAFNLSNSRSTANGIYSMLCEKHSARTLEKLGISPRSIAASIQKTRNFVSR